MNIFFDSVKLSLSCTVNSLNSNTNESGFETNESYMNLFD